MLVSPRDGISVSNAHRHVRVECGDASRRRICCDSLAADEPNSFFSIASHEVDCRKRVEGSYRRCRHRQEGLCWARSPAEIRGGHEEQNRRRRRHQRTNCLRNREWLRTRTECVSLQWLGLPGSHLLCWDNVSSVQVPVMHLENRLQRTWTTPSILPTNLASITGSLPSREELDESRDAFVEYSRASLGLAVARSVA